MTPMGFIETIFVSILIIGALSYYKHIACGLIISVMLFAFWIMNQFTNVGLVSHTSYIPYVTSQSIISIIIFGIALIIDFKIYNKYPNDRFSLATIVLSLVFLALAQPDEDYLVNGVILIILGCFTYYFQKKKRYIENEFNQSLNRYRIYPSFFKQFQFNTSNEVLRNVSLPDDYYINNDGLTLFANLLAIRNDGIVNEAKMYIDSVVKNGNVHHLYDCFRTIDDDFAISSFKALVNDVNKSRLLNFYLRKPINTSKFYEKIMGSYRKHIKGLKPISRLKNTFIGETGENRLTRLLKYNHFYTRHNINILYPTYNFNDYKTTKDFKKYFNIYHTRNHKIENNQIDVLVINRYGIFPLEVKTYSATKILINNKGQFFVCYPTTDTSNPHNRILNGQLVHPQFENFHRQLDNHVWAIRQMLWRHEKELNALGINISNLPIKSPLVYIRQNDTQHVQVIKSPYAPSDVNCIHYTENPGGTDNSPGLFKYITKPRGEILNSTQVNGLINIINQENSDQKKRQQDQSIVDEYGNKRWQYFLPTFPHLVVNNYNLFTYDYYYIYRLKLLAIISQYYSRKFWESIPIINNFIK